MDGKLEIDKQIYDVQCKSYNDILCASKSQYLTNEIAQSDTKGLFQIVQKLSCPKSQHVLPNRDSNEELADEFGEFFHDKICDLVNDLEVSCNTMDFESQPTSKAISQFEQVSESTVRKVIRESPCQLDPVPTWLMKECLDELLPFITELINLSLSSGIVPAAYKKSHVIPLLKKKQLDPDEFRHYRPISNLMFISKVLERIVTAQLRAYLETNDLFPCMQSAYRQFHSTETALIKVYNDLLLAVDRGLEAVLVLLDFSAAFETIDHAKLMCRLRHDYGFDGKVLQWLASYLEDRHQVIVVNRVPSKAFPLPWGVPQGSVLGPLLFSLYTGPLSEVIHAHDGVMHMMYADDTQLYIVLKQSDASSCISKLSRCVSDVKSWSCGNNLVFNGTKTEVMHITSMFRNSSVLPDLDMDGTTITLSQSAKDLGVTVDNVLNVNQHIRNVCRIAAFGIHKHIFILPQALAPTPAMEIVPFLSVPPNFGTIFPMKYASPQP
eukprot:XP_001200033.2 PREDICTED: RNA-directed DNA polymerase from mobile element jockey-like [Strongylocentrotus purpuratus]